MAKQEELVSVLNDLIKINNDRYDGYERALKDVKDLDVDLKGMFSEMADQSRKNISELTQEVGRLGGEAASDSTIPGKVHKAWMDLKATFTGKDCQSVLESCEFGEDVAQKAYQTALESDAYMSTDVRQLITNQQSKLKTSHDVVKKYRDLHEAVS